MEPSEVEERSEGPRSKRRQSLTLEQLESRAVDNGLGEQYKALTGFFTRHADHVSRTQNNIAFCFEFEDGRKTVLSLYPYMSSQEQGLRADVRPNMLAKVFSLQEDDIKQTLPDTYTPDEGGYGEIYYFRSVEEAQVLTQALSGVTEQDHTRPADPSAMEAEEDPV